MNGSQQITLVSGIPRSGTSMMMQMITAGGISAVTDAVREADQDNREGYFEFEPVKRTKQDSSWVSLASGKVVKVIYPLLYDLPSDARYRVVFMRRNLQEVLASQSEMLRRRGAEGATVAHEKLREIFAGQLAKVEEWLVEQDNFDVLYVDHRDAIDDPLTQAQRINAFLGGELDVDAMAAAVNPTLYRQRRDG